MAMLLTHQVMRPPTSASYSSQAGCNAEYNATAMCMRPYAVCLQRSRLDAVQVSNLHRPPATLQAGSHHNMQTTGDKQERPWSKGVGDNQQDHGQGCLAIARPHQGVSH